MRNSRWTVTMTGLALTAALTACGDDGSDKTAADATTDTSTSPSPSPTQVKPIEEPPGQTKIAATFGLEDMIHGNVAIGSGTSEPGAGNAPWPLPGRDEQPDMETPVDMWLTEPLTARVRDCIEHQIDPDVMREECIESDLGVALLTSADGTLGFTAYVHSAPQVVDDPLDPGGGFEALANLDGTEYVFTRGVFSAPGAQRLAAHLETSERPRLVLLVRRSPENQPTLLLDGEPASFPTDLVPGSPWNRMLFFGPRGLVPPGSHNVTASLPRGTKAALLVYEAQTEE